MKKLIIILLVTTFFIAGCQAQIGISSIHKPVSVADVSSIRVWGNGLPAGHSGRDATGKEISQIVKWLNESKDIRPNKDFAGTTPDSGIVINLKSGQSILILNSGSDFEVQREDIGKRVSYWAKNPELRDFLAQLATGSNTTDEKSQPPKLHEVIKNQEVLKLLLEYFSDSTDLSVFDYRENQKYAVAFINVHSQKRIKRFIFVKENEKWMLKMALDRKDYKNDSLFGYLTKKYYDFPQELIPDIDPLRY